MTTYPDELRRLDEHHTGACSYCVATGEKNPARATHGALAGQSFAVGPAACDSHADLLDARDSAFMAWSRVDCLAREAADDTALDFPLGALAVTFAGIAGIVTAHGPREVRLLVPGDGEKVYDIDEVGVVIENPAAVA